VKVEKEKPTALNSFYESIEVMFPIVFVKKKSKVLGVSATVNGG
jgi:hypothetical protein